MTIEWNKVTWYSKLFAVILFVLTFYIAFLLGFACGKTAEINYNIPAVVSPVNQPVATASYYCDAGKIISASYYNGASASVAVAGEPPVPTGNVQLKLSDERTMTLAQTISADGARYASADGSIVFWNKGNGVMFTENNKATYTNCIMVAKSSASLPNVYANGAKGFSLRYPDGFVVDSGYTYQELGPGKDIPGVKFIIPATLAKGTNLSTDSYLSVEQMPKATNCTADLFLGQGATASKDLTDGGTTYSYATLNGAAAGNRYDETVYALPGTNPCIAIRYLIHYGAIENYPAGMVKEFNEQAIINQFDQIRRTLNLN
jgi:membrane-bound inhibitor of C-type lysozyme